MSQKLNFMSARRIKLMLILGVVFIVNTAWLPAENVPTTHVDDPVIKAAQTLAESLSMEYKVKATADINLARQRLAMVAQHDAGSDRVYREAFERAKKIQNDYDRSQAFAQIARTIIPKDVNSYDEILKEESGYFVAEAILEQCTQTGQNDLAYLLFEKIMGMQTAPGTKNRMRLYINRIYPTQIHSGKMDEAVASAERIKDPELRKFVHEQIRNAVQQHLLQLLPSKSWINENRETVEKMLKYCYPDIDCSNWPDCLDEVIAKTQQNIEKMDDPGTRLSAYMHLIFTYRQRHGDKEYYEFMPDGLPAPKAKPSAPDPVLQDMLKAAAETAKKIDVAADNYKHLATVANISISNADDEMANEIVDHMMTIPEQLFNVYLRKESMFAVIPLLYQLKRTDEADKMCDDVLKLAQSEDGNRHGLSEVSKRVALEKQKADFR